ncbi:uncharacterized protein CIMG_13570 [Coccidioides immitis RS]|uniref:Uncharacterized protein n=1 Tax=Coccidioides immitis (strain RS) TaxID=246410 RepID=J3K1I0_COCIM|nr:uncharacterized protein CIMG_13570 [Coccidioides immitis RS]EAS27837.3 hypothetical protein CIMG_13570 [Coccidioides immitis RS]
MAHFPPMQNLRSQLTNYSTKYSLRRSPNQETHLWRSCEVITIGGVKGEVVRDKGGLRGCRAQEAFKVNAQLDTRELLKLGGIESSLFSKPTRS